LEGETAFEGEPTLEGEPTFGAVGIDTGTTLGTLATDDGLLKSSEGATLLVSEGASEVATLGEFCVESGAKPGV